jgi:uncharacterized membrane protein
MNSLPEKKYRSLFEITVILKGIIALGEVVLGLLLAFVSYSTLRGMAMALFGNELVETPPDFIWGYAIKGIHGFTATPQSVWVFIFLSHGLVKLALIGGLLRNKLWAYPWSAAIFTFFIIYQIWQMVFTPSLMLLFITVLDVIVVFLVLHEYRYRLRQMKIKQPS